MNIHKREEYQTLFQHYYPLRVEMETYQNWSDYDYWKPIIIICIIWTIENEIFSLLIALSLTLKYYYCGNNLDDAGPPPIQKDNGSSL